MSERPVAHGDLGRGEGAGDLRGSATPLASGCGPASISPIWTCAMSEWRPSGTTNPARSTSAPRTPSAPSRASPTAPCNATTPGTSSGSGSSSTGRTSSPRWWMRTLRYSRPAPPRRIRLAFPAQDLRSAFRLSSGRLLVYRGEDRECLRSRLRDGQRVQSAGCRRLCRALLATMSGAPRSWPPHAGRTLSASTMSMLFRRYGGMRNLPSGNVDQGRWTDAGSEL